MGLSRIAISLSSLVSSHDLVRKVCNFSGSCSSAVVSNSLKAAFVGDRYRIGQQAPEPEGWIFHQETFHTHAIVGCLRYQIELEVGTFLQLALKLTAL